MLNAVHGEGVFLLMISASRETPSSPCYICRGFNRQQQQGSHFQPLGPAPDCHPSHPHTAPHLLSRWRFVQGLLWPRSLWPLVT